MKDHRRSGVAAAVWAAAAAVMVTSAQAEILTVGFDQPHYYVRPLAPVSVRVEFQSTQPVMLFSYGFRLLFPSAAVQPVSPATVQVPGALDFNGVNGPGAIVAIEPGSVGVKGTVDFFITPPSAYGGTLLAQFDMVPILMGDHPMELQLFRTLGSTETVFVSGTGVPLDGQITFGTATLHVIPEPGLGALFGLGLLGMACHAVRARRPKAITHP